MAFQATAQSIPQVKKGASYASVRQALIKEGWKPVPQNEPAFGLAEEVRKQYKEVQACAASGFGACIFIFKNASGKILEVGTVGENLSFSTFR